MSDIAVLDPLTLPLQDTRLIEASAGTGKTFTIAALYLRLLLGLGKNAYDRPLSVEEILVVTFTKAATQELKNRIRQNIQQLRLACLAGSSEDPLYQALLAEISHPRLAAAYLLIAERQMDLASIYTLNGFCQRTLTLNTFEAKILFEYQLITDEWPYYQMACADFWRSHFYPLPIMLAQEIIGIWSSPDELLKELEPYLSGELPTINSRTLPDETLKSRHHKIITQLQQLQISWRQERETIEQRVIESDVEKRSYSKKNLPRWLSIVDRWATEELQSYQLPKEFAHFRQSVLEAKTKQGQAPSHPLFLLIDTLFIQPLGIRDLVFVQALYEIRQSVKQKKYQEAVMGFDDPLANLEYILTNDTEQRVATAIRNRFPVAMVDEFQDTDPQQYRMLERIYLNQPNCMLLLIGDPKQAIYAFRGADIFTYLEAKQAINHHYTLTVNWRASADMVAAVNQLFSCHNSPFLLTQIPFYPVKPAKINTQLYFDYLGHKQPALFFWLQAGESVNLNDYQAMMARQCAAQIRDWLTAAQQQQAWLVNGQHKKQLTAQDIAILVRSRKEAELVQHALNHHGISSVFLSNRDNVFTTPEAKEVLWILQAVLFPDNEKLVRTALACHLFTLSDSELDYFFNTEQQWERIIDEFVDYRQYWQSCGILPMLRKLISKRKIAETLLSTSNGERRLTDLMHIGELLQEASLVQQTPSALLTWLTQQIMQPAAQIDNYQMRLESDRNLVQIITVHKSKGLEYNVVMLPFIATFRRQTQALYHDREHFHTVLDLENTQSALLLAEEERLAEDLRLLYVAVTRAIYFCGLGVAPIVRDARQQTVVTDFHHSAIGYLLQQGQAGDAQVLQERLKQLKSQYMDYALLEETDNSAFKVITEVPTVNYQACELTRAITINWQLTSYSHLISREQQVWSEFVPNLEQIAPQPFNTLTTAQFSPHDFPKGNVTGIFLHTLLEEIDFTQPIDQEFILNKLASHQFSSEWCLPLCQWLTDILHTPLGIAGLSLSHINQSDKSVELPFYLPIKCTLQPDKLHEIAKEYDRITANCASLSFREIEGMLKGFIDLVFCWQERFYLLDYKSNWLGESDAAYEQAALEKAMCEHRYDLQYQLYTLALHRYLQQRLVNYDYEKHFGGVFYLFIRGMQPHLSGQGVFYERPAWAMIKQFDDYFTGK